MPTLSLSVMICIHACSPADQHEFAICQLCWKQHPCDVLTHAPHTVYTVAWYGVHVSTHNRGVAASRAWEMAMLCQVMSCHVPHVGSPAAGLVLMLARTSSCTCFWWFEFGEGCGGGVGGGHAGRQPTQGRWSHDSCLHSQAGAGPAG